MFVLRRSTVFEEKKFLNVCLAARLIRVFIVDISTS